MAGRGQYAALSQEGTRRYEKRKQRGSSTGHRYACRGEELQSPGMWQ
jgi:hypothetical protein